MQTSVLIVGGGLAGLTLARRLHIAGVDFQLLEARDRFGGRVLSVDRDGRPSPDGFDLGPSWFWPKSQFGLATLVEALGLTTFQQHTAGDVVFHRMSREAPQRYRGFQQTPLSMRLAGGTGALIAALADCIPAQRLHHSSEVTQVEMIDTGVVATVVTADGETTLSAKHIVLALPPRVLEARVTFTPEMEPADRNLWRSTPTWMAPHAKFFAIYDRPFWREMGLSGSAQSLVGPLSEIHDATSASGVAALFGFVGVSSAQRKVMGLADLKAACVEQLSLLFGSDASRPAYTLLKDWSADPLTAAPLDSEPSGHPAGGVQKWITGAWKGRAWMAGSEASPLEPGYLAGAVEAADRIADHLIPFLTTETFDDA